MTTCKYCDSMNVKWKNIAKNGDPEKWELWNEKDNSVAEDVIYKLLLEVNWDIMSLQIVNEGV